ncbi:hypothetical protein [Nocardioides dongkuii]|uniref:hypothetical protein n=1 Tax=Nocardioides dongkuii TaxID=2760089 RepID=UPI0015FC78CA|nr:hypothetical protein [Nocardioides dongkuii]
MPLTPPALAVRLRRLWAGEIVTSDELATSPLGVAWHECDLALVGTVLTVVGPARCRDALAGPLGELLARRASEVTRAKVTDVRWRTGARPASVRPDRTSDTDVFGAQDPLLDAYPSILADLRAAVPANAAPAALAAVGALRLVGVSRHRLWFAARTSGDRDALGKVPGARAALFVAVQTYQGVKRPLHHVLVDPSYRAKGLLLG